MRTPSPRRRPLLVLAALGALVVAAAGAAEPPARREQGALVYDGVPEEPKGLREAQRPYSSARSAALVGWHPEGEGLLVSTRFGETAQVHHVAGPGADRQQWTFAGEPTSAAAWDPADLTGIYVRRDVGGREDFQWGWLSRADGQITWLTEPNSRNESLAVAPQGGFALFTGTARNGVDYDLYRVDRHDPSTRVRLLELEGDWQPTAISPDGTHALLRRHVSATEGLLELVDLEARTHRPLLPGAPPADMEGGSFGADGKEVWFVSDAGQDLRQLHRVDLATGAVQRFPSSREVEGVAVSRDGRRLAWVENVEGASHLYLGTTAHPERARVVEALPLGVVGGVAFDPTGARLAVGLSAPRSPGDVYVVEVRGPGDVTRWTRSEAGGLDPSRFVEPELVRWKSFDGLEIPGWYHRAPGPGRHPVIVAIHGGPEGQARPSFHPTAQYWIDHLGAAVIQPNVRGSTGYGRTYTQLDDGARRMDSVKDLVALVDWIAAQPELDPERVVLYGGSYGGFMVLAGLAELGPRARCGVDIVGISHFVTFLENTQAYRRDLRRVEYGDERIPEMRSFLESISPRNRVDRIVAPLLVIQGQNDPRVPASEAEGIVAAMRGAGREAWYLLARDEGHGFKKLSNLEAKMAVETMFLERCLR